MDSGSAGKKGKPPPGKGTRARGIEKVAGGGGGGGGKKERPPPIRDDTGTPETKAEAAGAGGGEKSKKTNWTLHAINVKQGDAILLELHTEPPKRYLIDGGTGDSAKGDTKPLENLKACLEKQRCLSRSVSKKKELKVDAIIVTHPDKDHVGGVTKLLEEYSYNGELVITEAFKRRLEDELATTKEQKKGKRGPKPFLPTFFDAVEETFGEKQPRTLDSKRKRYGSLHCHFPKTEIKGVLYSPRVTEGGQASATVATGDGSGGKKAATATARPKKLTDKLINESSILTTVNVNDEGFDVLLTGDSYAALIKKVISEKAKGQLHKPHIKVFQVPHHGSKMNSHYNFYISFTAEVYLISGGGHDGYGHPHMQVLSSIIKACVDNKYKSNIVVTNSLGLNQKKLEEMEALVENPTWRESVTIYHLNDVSSAVKITDQGLECSSVIIWNSDLVRLRLTVEEQGQKIDKLQEEVKALKDAVEKKEETIKEMTEAIMEKLESLKVTTSTPDDN